MFGTPGARLSSAAAAPPLRSRTDLPKPSLHSHLLRVGRPALRFGCGIAEVYPFVVEPRDGLCILTIPDLPPGAAQQFLERHAGQRFVISIICAGEFYAGSEDFADAHRFLARFRRLEIHEAVAQEAGRLEREQRQRGRPLGENDTWIAATARLPKRPLVTRDKAFRRVRRLRVEPY